MRSKRAPASQAPQTAPQLERPKRKPRRKPDAIPSVNGNGNGHPLTSESGAELPYVWADQIKERRTQFLWDMRVATGFATMLTGEMNIGKSTLLTSIVASVTRGDSLPGGPTIAGGKVVWLTREESPDESVKPRLLAAGARMDRIAFAGYGPGCAFKRRFALPSSTADLVELVKAVGACLLVIDPIISFLDDAMGIDSAHTARTVSQSVTDIAQGAGCAAIFTKHPRKGRAGIATDQVSGSKEWMNQPRCVLALGKHPVKDDTLVLGHLKCSWGKAPTALDCAIEGDGKIGVLAWRGDSAFTADDAFGAESDPVARDQLTLAKLIIRDRLDSGEKASVDMLKAATDEGISPRTLARAKKELSVTSHPIGPIDKRYHVWRKPKKGWPD